MPNAPTFDSHACMELVRAAASDGKISESAIENIEAWLTESRYSEYAPAVVEHINDGKWQELDDVFGRSFRSELVVEEA